MSEKLKSYSKAMLNIYNACHHDDDVEFSDYEVDIRHFTQALGIPYREGVEEVISIRHDDIVTLVVGEDRVLRVRPGRKMLAYVLDDKAPDTTLNVLSFIFHNTYVVYRPGEITPDLLEVLDRLQKDGSVNLVKVGTSDVYTLTPHGEERFYIQSMIARVINF